MFKWGSQHAVLRWGRRIAFPLGGTPPPARELSACPFVNSRQGILARHLGWSFAALDPFLEPPGVLLRLSWSLLGRSWRPLVSPSLPQRPRTEHARNSLHFFFSPLKLPKALLTSLHFSSLFWSRLGSLLGSILAPSWGPFWPNLGPSRLLKPYLFQKR